MKVYKGLENIPDGHASKKVTNGCLVLEGGAWRGIYTQGVLDAFMQKDLNFQTTIGVSAGAMGGISYVSGQIGRSARINLTYRHDQNYCGVGAMKRDKGITGFSYLFEDISEKEPLDEETFYDEKRRFVVVATDVEEAKAKYFEKGKCTDILKAVQASASVPYVTKPVEIEGRKYLDGGIAAKVPYEWALAEGFSKIVVIRTRDKSYRKPIGKYHRIIDAEYSDYPDFKHLLHNEVPNYNISLDKLDQLEEQGRLFVIAPSKPVTISRFEGNMNRLGDLYWEGYNDANNAMSELFAYLGKDE